MGVRSLPLPFVAAAAVALTAFGGAGMAVAIRPDPEPSSARFDEPIVERVRTLPATPAPKAAKRTKPRPGASETARPVVVRTAAVRPTPQPMPVRTPRPVPVVRSSGGPANYTALLIGLDKPDGSEPLKGSVDDGRTMRALLLRQGWKPENITVLTDETATHDAILHALDRLAARTSGKGLAVFQLATHSGMSGGDMTFASGGGGRVSRADLATRLGRVRGKLWSTLATCYAASYAVPGIAGEGRIAAFSSSKDEESFQIPGAGSVLVVNMVQRAMLEQGATSVEDAFAWAKVHVGSTTGATITLKDGIAGDVIVRAG